MRRDSVSADLLTWAPKSEFGVSGLGPVGSSPCGPASSRLPPNSAADPETGSCYLWHPGEDVATHSNQY